MLSVLRIVAAMLFLTHGTQKLFGVPGGSGPPVPLMLVSERGLAAVLETFGGVALLVGLFTRPAAFVLSGEMAVAYFQVHFPRSFLPMANGGEPPVLFCFLFLYLVFAGPGRWSLDAFIANRRPNGTVLGAFCLLIFGIALPAQAQDKPCSPATPDATRAHLSLVRQALDSNPAHPIHLFRLAVDYVALCDDSAAFAALDRMTGSYGGLDPSVYRGFVRVQSATRFREIVAKIRALNPPVVASAVAFTFDRPDLFPEGMAYDSASQRVYAGSSASRNIMWTDRTGELHELVSSGQDGLGTVLGLHVDARRHHLWAVSTGATGAGTAHVVRGLFEYELPNGRLVARYAIPDTTAEMTFNDVVVAPSTGIAYTTHSPRGSVYAAVPGDPVLREIVPAGSLPQANGITISADDSLLFVAAGFGVSKVELRTRRVTALQLAPGVVAATIDGLYRYGHSLIGIQNGVHPGRVMRFDLDRSMDTITRSVVLEAYNPLFDGPTTGAVTGQSFLFIANTQGRRRNAGQAQDTPPLKPVLVLRLPLDR